MRNSTVTRLIGMKIIGQHGREVGVVSDMTADVDTWELKALEVKLNRSALDALQLARPWFGSQRVHVPIAQISGVSDTLVLTCPLEDMEFTKGEPDVAPPLEPQ